MQGKYDQAEPLYRRAIAITEKTLGTGHPSYSTNLNNLGGLLEQQVRARVSLGVLTYISLLIFGDREPINVLPRLLHYGRVNMTRPSLSTVEQWPSPRLRLVQTILYIPLT